MLIICLLIFWILWWGNKFIFYRIIIIYSLFFRILFLILWNCIDLLLFSIRYLIFLRNILRFNLIIFFIFFTLLIYFIQFFDFLSSLSKKTFGFLLLNNLLRIAIECGKGSIFRIQFIINELFILIHLFIDLI